MENQQPEFIAHPVDLKSLTENFPEGFAVPPLLREFGQWLTDKHWGTIGGFRIKSDRFDGY